MTPLLQLFCAAVIEPARRDDLARSRVGWACPLLFAAVRRQPQRFSPRTELRERYDAALDLSAP